MFNVNNRNTRTRCEITSKFTIKTPERRHWRRTGVFIVNFEHISHLVLIVNFEQVNAGWDSVKYFCFRTFILSFTAAYMKFYTQTYVRKYKKCPKINILTLLTDTLQIENSWNQQDEQVVILWNNNCEGVRFSNFIFEQN